MDQLISFVGRGMDLATAVGEAQRAANAWLIEHAMAIGTIYSTTGQSLWHEPDGSWFHVIMLTLELRGATPPQPDAQPPAARDQEPKGKKKRAQSS